MKFVRHAQPIISRIVFQPELTDSGALFRFKVDGFVQGYLAHMKQRPPAVGLCLGSYGSPWGGGGMSEVPLYDTLSLATWRWSVKQSEAALGL